MSVVHRTKEGWARVGQITRHVKECSSPTWNLKNTLEFQQNARLMQNYRIFSGIQTLQKIEKARLAYVDDYAC